MLKCVSMKIANWTFQVCPVKEEVEKEIICLGIYFSLKELLTIIFLLMIGYYLGRLENMVLCMLLFSAFRIQLGGYHCNTFLKCRFFMTYIFYLSIMIPDFVVFTYEIQKIIYVILIVMTILLKVNAGNEQSNLTKRKTKAIIILVISFILTLYVRPEISTSYTVALAWEIALLILVQKDEKKIKRNSSSKNTENC